MLSEDSDAGQSETKILKLEQTLGLVASRAMPCPQSRASLSPRIPVPATVLQWRRRDPTPPTSRPLDNRRRLSPVRPSARRVKNALGCLRFWTSSGMGSGVLAGAPSPPPTRRIRLWPLLRESNGEIMLGGITGEDGGIGQRGDILGCWNLRRRRLRTPTIRRRLCATV
jgi:hypothetical protein